MKDCRNMEKVYEAVELLNDFCADTACPECPIRKLCNRIDKNVPIGAAIIKNIKETVSTIIHETTHARINKPNTKNQELECYKNECRYLGIELTDDIVAGIMKHIDKKYPYLEWE